jgi:hypothetical protein
MADIFISYARKDREKVAALAKALSNQGWTLWWDPEIRTGTPFDRVIEKALKDARSVLVVWSHNSVDSDWVRAEATDGLDRGILISVAIEPIVKPPLRFRYIHTEQLIDWDGKKPSASFDKIVADLKAMLKGPETPKDFEIAKVEPPKPPEAVFRDSARVKEPPEKTKQGVAEEKAPIIKKSDHPDLNSMVKVPAGHFIYQDGKAKIEKPYMIDVYPVTNSQFRKFIEAGGYMNRQSWSAKGWEWRKISKAAAPDYWDDEKWNQPGHPVVGVSFYEAEAYVKWSGKRLPTEKEWERAACGTDGRKYPWGNEFDPERCNTAESKIERTTPVTRYPNGVSVQGCYDMAGNVWEWCQDWFDESKYFKVLRGGSWGGDRFNARCSGRNRDHPDDRFNFSGFRCVRTLD